MPPSIDDIADLDDLSGRALKCTHLVLANCSDCKLKGNQLISVSCLFVSSLTSWDTVIFNVDKLVDAPAGILEDIVAGGERADLLGIAPRQKKEIYCISGALLLPYFFVICSILLPLQYGFDIPGTGLSRVHFIRVNRIASILTQGIV